MTKYSAGDGATALDMSTSTLNFPCHSIYPNSLFLSFAFVNFFFFGLEVMCVI